MPAVLESPKLASKQEEFVEKQIESARSRIRALDVFSAGLMLLIGSLVFLFAVLVVDRFVETPAGTGWGLVGLYVVAAAGYLWWTLFRPSRRQINPYYAARRVEETLPEAKNSVISFVDLKDDATVPASVKTAIGTKAARDLKHVDLNQAIQKKQVLSQGIVAGIVFIAAAVAVFLPPTRTSLSITTPEGGNTTVTQGEDFRLEVAIRGRVPDKGEPDAARARIWYNAEDPATYEERSLEPVENQKRVLGLTIPAKQVRSGFHYKVLAGNAQTPDYEVKYRVIPQFTGWDVDYKFPEYLKREAEKKKNDPNLVGYYGTEVTVTAFTNRPVRSCSVLIGDKTTVPGQLVDGNLEAIRFQFSMMENSSYRMRFVTIDDMQNPAPQAFKISLVDPKPAFVNFDVTFDYPKYRRWQSETVNRREPNIEALRGTKITLVANANRPVKEATLEYQGKQLPGEPIKNEPLRVKFTLPELMEDEHYRVWFQPKTSEAAVEPRSFSIQVLSDEPPKVYIQEPAQDPVDVPANGALPIKGYAEDDVGVTKINLRMEVTGKKNTEGKIVPLSQKVALKPKPYRGGISFRRDDDSYPERLDYLDVAEIAKLRPDGIGVGDFKIEPGMEIEYWLEAFDNCDVPQAKDRPVNRGESIHRHIIVGKPLLPKEQQQQQAQNQRLEQEKKKHDQQQDEKNAKEKRDPKQQRQKGDQPQQEQGQANDQKQPGEPKKGDGSDMPPMADPNDQNQLDKETQQLENDLQQNPNQQKNPPKTQPNDPNNPQKKNMGEDAPKTQPNDNPQQKNMGEGAPQPNEPNNPQKKNMGEDAPKTQPNEPNNPQKKNMGEDAPKTQPNEPNNPQKKNMGEDAPKTQPNDNPQQKNNDPNNPQKKNMGNSGGNPMSGGDSGGDTDPKNLPKPEDFKELADKLQSNDPKEQEKAREQLKKMMEQSQKNPPDKQQQQKKIDEHRQNLNPEEKQKFDDAMEKLRQEMKDLKRDEKVQKAAEKAMSNDKAEQKQGQQELQNLMEENPNQVEQELQRLEGKQSNQERKDRLDDARRLSREKLKKSNSSTPPMPPMPKEPEEDVDKLIKKKESGTPEEKEQAKNELENKLQDPNQRDRVQQKLNEFRNKLGSNEEKQKFDQSMKEMKEDIAKKQNGGDGQPKPKPEDIERFAKQLQSDDAATRKQAQEQLTEAMKQADKDPKARENAEKQIDKMRNEIKDENKKKDFDNALKQINDAVQEQRQQQAKQQKEDVEQVANDLNSGDPDKHQAAQQKLENMLKDPQKKNEIKKQLDQAKKGMGEQGQKKIDDAIKQAEDKLAKKGGNGGDSAEPKKDDLKKLADDLNSNDPAKQQAAKDKLENMLKDSKNKEPVKNQLDQAKKGMGEQGQKKIDDAIKQAEDKLAKKGGNGGDSAQPKKDDLKQLADDLNSNDPAKQQAAKDKLEDMLKDPKNKEAVKNQLDQAKKGMGEQGQKKIDDAIKQAEDKLAKKGGNGGDSAQPKKDDLKQLADDLNSNDPAKQQAAKDKLEDMLKDPKNKEAVKNQLDQAKKGMGEQGQKKIDDAVKQAEDKLAKKGGNGGDSAEPKKDDLKKLAEDLNSTDPAKQQAAKEKLENMLKDPKNKEAVKNQLDQAKKGMGEQGQKKIDDAIKQAEDKLAKKGGNSGDSAEPKKDDLKKLADDLNSKEPAKQQAAQQKLENMLKDPKNAEAVKQALDKMKQEMPGDQAKKLDDAVAKAKDDLAKDDLAKKDLAKKDLAKKDLAKKETPPLKKEDLEQMAKKLNELSKEFKGMDPAQQQAAKRKMEEMLNDPKTREHLEKYLEDLRNQMKDGKAKEDLGKLGKQLKEMTDKLAKKDAQSGGKGSDLSKHDGKTPGGNTESEVPGALADMKNKAKAGELLLKKFDNNESNKEFRKEMEKKGWTEERIQKYRQMIDQLKKNIEQSESGQLPLPRATGPSAFPSVPEKVGVNERDSGKTLQRGKIAAPPGFADSYKRFTEEVSGVQNTAPKK